MKNTLVQLSSGTIDLVHENGKMLLQFNAECLDALPFCKGMCCKLQNYLSVQLNNKEITKFGQRVARSDETIPPGLIPVKSGTTECKYSQDNLCSVHTHKPERCKSWHCSPGGKGEGITVRSNGWLMLPS